jgi:hypothetical protein
MCDVISESDIQNVLLTMNVVLMNDDSIVIRERVSSLY